MARVFELGVVAEGVETEEQLSTFQQYNCQEYQGYLFSKSIPIDEFTGFIMSQRHDNWRFTHDHV